MIWKVWIYIMIGFLLLYSFSMALENIVGSEDWNRYHSIVVNDYLKGDFTGNYDSLGVPQDYPHAFHFIMMPFVALSNFLGIGMTWFQVVLAFSVNIVLLLFASKYHGKTSMLVLSILMLSNMIFLMYYSSLTPQTIEIMLFPMLLYYLDTKYYSHATLVLGLMGYLHLSGMIWIIITFIYSAIFRRDFLKWWLLAMIIISPVILSHYVPTMQNIFFPTHESLNFLEDNGVTRNIMQLWFTDETEYMARPEMLILFNGFVMLLLPYFVYKFGKAYIEGKLFNLSKIQIFYFIMLLCFIPILYLNVIRGMSYLIIPLMMLEASVFTTKGE